MPSTLPSWKEKMLVSLKPFCGPSVETITSRWKAHQRCLCLTSLLGEILLITRPSISVILLSGSGCGMEMGLLRLTNDLLVFKWCEFVDIVFVSCHKLNDLHVTPLPFWETPLSNTMQFYSQVFIGSVLCAHASLAWRKDFWRRLRLTQSNWLHSQTKNSFPPWTLSINISLN